MPRPIVDANGNDTSNPRGRSDGPAGYTADPNHTLPYDTSAQRGGVLTPYVPAFEAKNPGLLDQQAYGDFLRKQMAGLLGGPGSAMGPVADQQSALVRMLQAQASGSGPSLAQQQLQHGLEQIQQQSAGAIASQKGINPGLQARMILDAQNQASQGAAGRSALLRSSEMMGAQGMLGNALGMQRGQDLAQQGQNLHTLGTLGNLNQNQNELYQRGALNAQDLNARMAMFVQGTGASKDQNDTAFLDSLGKDALGGLLGGGSSALGKMAMGTGGGGGADLFKTELGGSMGAIPAFSPGGMIPGRASVRGDSYANDKVPAKLSPGEIVLPRSVAQADDAPEAAASFVRAIRRKDSGGKGEAPHYGHVVKFMRESDARLKKLEQLACGGAVKGYAEGGEARNQTITVEAKPMPVRMAPMQKPAEYDPVAMRRVLMNIIRPEAR